MINQYILFIYDNKFDFLHINLYVYIHVLK